ncbi:MAG: hypothetical protein ACK4E0_19065 [Chitinophagaceae bacterium]
MKIERKKELLVSLILDDLVHARLVDGLMALGMPAASYAHDVPFAVMELMGFNEEQQHQIFPGYRLWQEEARWIDISKGNFQMRHLAERIYEMLEKISKSNTSADQSHSPAMRNVWARGCQDQVQ